jgi:GTPase Era involved in 16S rRNA processing
MSSQDADPLRQYTLAKQEVSACIRQLKQSFETSGDQDRSARSQDLLVKLAEDRFNLAVVGQFKRGKSSLMNAVIERDLLPTGVLPLTSVITALCFGPQARAMLQFKGWSLEQEISLDELADYVTERGNPGNEKNLQIAQVEVPVPFLRRGLYFIDTPGIGSAQHANTATTYEFLPQADAIIFVTSVEAPLSEAEEIFLRDVRRQVRQLFVVVNKMDLVTSNERDEILDYLRTGIERALAVTEVRLYPLSARQGLEAKLKADAENLQQSGLKQFETDLTEFLVGEKSRVFLISILDRALSLLNPETASIEAVASPQWIDLQHNLETIRAALLAGQPLEAAVTRSDLADTRVLDRAVQENQIEQAQLDDRKLLRSRTCPICDAQLQAIFDFFVHWQYALAKDRAAQQSFAAARGFCYVHTWQFEQVASPQGISEGYAPLIDATTIDLRQLLTRPADEAAARLQDLLPDTDHCAACQVLRETETNLIDKLLSQLASREGQAQYARSRGLCVPHLYAVLAKSPTTDAIEFLLREQIQHLEKISEDMRSYMLKRDALRRGLQNADERNAWRHALVQLTGERNVRALWSAEIR